MDLEKTIREIIEETIEKHERFRDEEKEFIERYVAVFLATWAANNYNAACARDKHDMLAREAPLEDARTLAEEAWKRVSSTFYGALM